MSMLVDGRWVIGDVRTTDDDGNFIREASTFRDWVKADGSSKFKPEAGRYHLYVSYACPWACRTLVGRALKGLEDAISYSYVDAFMGEQGWTFGEEGEATKDPIHGKNLLQEIYVMADPKCTCKVTVPVLWDKKTNTIVNNESSEILRMLNAEFNELAKKNVDLYPSKLQAEIDEVNDFVYDNINNGVYKTGFAKTQDAYEKAFDKLFSALGELENRLSKSRYLVGDVLTEADWRLFTTLVRFDVVYVGHFKCNLKRIVDYPNLWGYLKELYQVPGIKETVNFEHIKNHYYQSHLGINPTSIVPKGPAINFDEPHGRG